MSSTQWWGKDQRGKFGTPVATFDSDLGIWTVAYGGETITITQQALERSCAAVDDYVRDFIATTDRGEKFNGVSRQSHSSRSGNSAPAQSGARVAYPCIICGRPGESSSSPCQTCLGHYLGADPGTVPLGAVNWPPSPIQQSVAGLKQQIWAHIWNEVMSGSSIPPSAYAQNLKPPSPDDDQNAAAIMALVAAMKAQQALQQQKWSRIYSGLYDPAGTLDPPVPVSEFITGEIRAWRAWIIGENGYLRSISHSTVWPPGEVIEGKVTSAEHGGGVYAFKDPGKLFGFCMSDYAPSGVVWGSVLLWGDVIEHELGYRAQFCQIDNLCGVYPAPETGQQVETLRRVYGLTP